MKPPESKITIEPGMRGETTVTIPPKGIKAGDSVGTGFLCFWLCGWAVGEGFAIYSLLGMASGHVKGGDAAGAGFLLIWLTFWTIGGLVAMAQAYAGLRSMFGYERWIFEFGTLTRDQSLWGVRLKRTFTLSDTPTFEMKPGPTATQRLPGVGRLHFRSGNRTVYIAPTATSEEQEWLVAELNEIAQRYKA